MQALQIVEPLNAAWKRMVQILFRPFNMSKWFLLGFSAWLAIIGEQAGSGFSAPDFSGFTSDEIDMDFSGIEPYLPIIISVAILIVVISIVLSLVLLWVRCRGKFMFLSNLALDRTEIKNPWRTYRAEGNSLFLWSAVFGLICLVLVMLILIPFVLFLIQVLSTEADNMMGPLIGISVIEAFLLILFGITAGYVWLFLESFIVPLMYIHRCSAREAWRHFGTIYRQAPWSYILYGLFRFVIDMAIGFAVLALILITCCCAALFLSIPYLHAVVLLPVLVLIRLYSLEFLKQLGPDFDVWRVPPPTPHGEVEALPATGPDGQTDFT